MSLARGIDPVILLLTVSIYWQPLVQIGFHFEEPHRDVESVSRYIDFDSAKRKRA